MPAYNPDKETDPAKLRSFMENVKAGHPDLYRRAFRRLCQLQGRSADDPLEAVFEECLAALEQLYYEEHGKHLRAGRLRRKRNKDGAVATFEYLAAQKKPSDGFRSLVEAGLPEFTAEHVALRHPDRFTEKAIEASRKKLTDEGIPLPGDGM